jgi:hypothetical protein
MERGLVLLVNRVLVYLNKIVQLHWLDNVEWKDGYE